MLKKAANQEVKIEKLNLIPIMDAVFIFIFFLLFSAQFIKIYDIESNAPVVSEVPEDKKVDKEPLNLKVKISSTGIMVTKGFNDIVMRNFSIVPNDEEEYTELKEFVLDVRKKNPDDDYVIVAPMADVTYDEIVRVIDAVKTLPKDVTELSLVVKGKKKKVTTIFDQIVLEPME